MKFSIKDFFSKCDQIRDSSGICETSEDDTGLQFSCESLNKQVFE